MIKNLFITFEGCEGTGKSSQLKLLVNTLKKTSIKFIATREPGGAKEGESIREILLTHRLPIQPVCETRLHMAARYQNLKKVIFPALKSGKWVLCDRYTDSTIAYQGYGHGVGPQKIKKISKIAFGDLEPDITFILDMPAKKALKRAKLRKIDFNRYERMGISFHNKVRRAFLKIAKKDSKGCFVLNAEKDRKEIHQEIKEIINKTYKTKLK